MLEDALVAAIIDSYFIDGPKKKNYFPNDT
jgi:hypothetical protein